MSITNIMYLTGYAFVFQGQDDHLLESPGSVQFLMKLLKPIVSTAIKDKAPKFGYKLLSLRQNDDILKNMTMTGRLDSSSVEVFSRVQEILVNCKELKTCQNDSWGERPELCPKWLALLTMEKACLSAISLDGIVKDIYFQFVLLAEDVLFPLLYCVLLKANVVIFAKK